MGDTEVNFNTRWRCQLYPSAVSAPIKTNSQLPPAKSKGTVIPVLIQARYKTHGRVEAQLHSILTLAADGGEWPALCPGSTIQGKQPQFPMDRRLDGPQRLSCCYGEISWPSWESTLIPPSSSPQPDHYTGSAID